MISQIKLTHHAIQRFNERIGTATPDDIMHELYRAREKHLDILGKRKARHVYIPSPVAVFVGCVKNGQIIIKTVLQRGAA